MGLIQFQGKFKNNSHSALCLLKAGGWCSSWGKRVMERLEWWRKQGGESRRNSLGFHKSDKLRLEKCMLAMWLLVT